ncbi:response regulator [Caulobacter endophyticus]|uniref:Response regulatory domain-containing protein n=1 Tax=Caulobacter endophyticus TaxID=2172652 RepID=A0A2T9K9V6_9CAUL|nr:response regulator [Caulobacter endophyticus]PVM92754.1 hypothetical protein DDF67_05155 [Caulobacter endophyticus]
MTAAAGRRGATLLVVEDEPIVRMVASDHLRDADYIVLEAGSALEALAMLEHHGPIALVFTDIDMPGPIDGLGLQRIVGQRWPDIAVLITSGLHGPTGPDASPFLAKPYDLSKLVRLVEALLRSAHA